MFYTPFHVQELAKSVEIRQKRAIKDETSKHFIASPRSAQFRAHFWFKIKKGREVEAKCKSRPKVGRQWRHVQWYRTRNRLSLSRLSRLSFPTRPGKLKMLGIPRRGGISVCRLLFFSSPDISGASPAIFAALGFFAIARI